MKKKIVALTLTFVLCLSGACLVACGGSSSSSNNTNTTNSTTTNNTNTNKNATNNTNTNKNANANASSSSSGAMTEATYDTLITKYNTLVDLYNRVGTKYQNDNSIAADAEFEAAMNTVGQAMDLVKQLDRSNCTEADAQAIIKSLDECIAAYQKAATALGV